MNETLLFFIEDSIKIIVLLFLMIFVIGFFRTYISQKKLEKWVKGRGILGNLIASLFGAITPFCSCSSIPIFLGFLEAGVPLGTSFSFLITSPLVNEYLAVLMLGFFGWKITVYYILAGVLLGFFGGIVLGKMKLEDELVKDMVSKLKEKEYKTIKQRLRFGLDEAIEITKKIWLWVIVGVGIGSLIHNFVPDELVQTVVAKGGILGVPAATLLGIPFYASCAAIVPVALVLFQKGFPLGTALAFMMASAGLSLPEAVILRRAMKLKLITIFFSIVGIGILIIGYIFNILI